MNKFVKQQLMKSKCMSIPRFSDTDTEIFIPRSGVSINQNKQLQVDSNYFIYVENYVINEPENFTLSANWNGGTKPPENKLFVRVVGTSGKMIKVIARGASTGIVWEGWLPQKSISVLEV